MSYRGDFVKYYDRIFAKKNYSREVEYVLEAYQKHSSSPLETVLDFGCGTGTHALYLSENKKLSVLGYDQSSDMIKVAKEKLNGCETCEFVNERSELIERLGKFDLAMSMFYVVNHLTTLKELNNCLGAISFCLKEGGVFVFDAWNGIAAIKDPPHSSTRERYSEGNTKIKTKCIANTDLFKSEVVMKNYVEVYENKELVDKFNYDLKHSLWTPHILKELLNQYGFEILEINKSYDINKRANTNDYKLMFVCKHRGRGV
tara:strand:+ start:72 stop:848 length:777 start_codon:yes stop_codon:yes gene_type:complete